MSRCRNIAPKSPNIENFPPCIHPVPSPLSTTVRTFWRTESRPVLHAESACHLHLPVAAPVGALLAESVPIFECPSFFCLSLVPPPSPIFQKICRSLYRICLLG